MTRYFSEDRTRMLDDDPPLVVAAAYEVKLIGDSYEGNHVGIFEDKDDALNWLKYGEPRPKKIHVGRPR